jgi:hypothetical protein
VNYELPEQGDSFVHMTGTSQEQSAAQADQTG